MRIMCIVLKKLLIQCEYENVFVLSINAMVTFIFFNFRYTMIFVFYIFGVICLLTIRPWFIDRKSSDSTAGVATLYAGLYLYPILAILHAIGCGFICKWSISKSNDQFPRRYFNLDGNFSDYMFPYLVIIVSVISNAVHFATKINQVKKLSRNYDLIYELVYGVFSRYVFRCSPWAISSEILSPAAEICSSFWFTGCAMLSVLLV